MHSLSVPGPAGPGAAALCALCAREGDSCCRTDPALGHLSFPLSTAEWRRLSAYAELAAQTAPDNAEGPRQRQDKAALPQRGGEAQQGDETPQRDGEAQQGDEAPQRGDDICQSWPNRPDFVASMHSLFPGKKRRIHELFPAQGSHLSLRLTPDGACVFLGDKGCRLPRRARPWYCLLFPAWMVQDSPTLFMAEGCLICERADNPLHGIGMLGENVSGIRSLHAALRRDWGLWP